MSYTVANCCYLNNGITEAKDAMLDKLKGFDSLQSMYGNGMKSVLDAANGAGQWEYTDNSLPRPKVK